MLVVGFASGRIPQYSTNLALLRSCSLVGVNYQHFFANDRQQVEENFAELMQMLADKKIKPYIDRVYPLHESVQALECVAQRKSIGKIAVAVKDKIEAIG